MFFWDAEVTFVLFPYNRPIRDATDSGQGLNNGVHRRKHDEPTMNKAFQQKSQLPS